VFVGVGVFVGVDVSVGVGVFVGVLVAVGVGVSVGVFVGVDVSVGVGVFVGVLVAVGVDVSVGVFVGVDVSVGVGVFVGVLVAVGVDVSVGVLVGVAVARLVTLVQVASLGATVSGSSVRALMPPSAVRLPWLQTCVPEKPELIVTSNVIVIVSPGFKVPRLTGVIGASNGLACATDT